MIIKKMLFIYLILNLSKIYTYIFGCSTIIMLNFEKKNFKRYILMIVLVK
jgi:hypothetical protein